MSQLLSVFIPPADPNKKSEENQPLNGEDEKKIEMEFLKIPKILVEHTSEECDINDYVNWIDSVQMTITADDVSALAKSAERRRQQTISEEDNQNEHFDSKFGRTFSIKRVAEDEFPPPPSERRLLREGTPNLSNITPALQERWKKRGDDAFLAMISALYAKILVMMGLAFPMTEVISSDGANSSGGVNSSTFLAFYLYLYFGSIFYFLYVFAAHLWYRINSNRTFPWCKKKATDVEELKQSDDSPSNEGAPRTPHHHGSFYLRIGAVVFGVGSMIYSGLEFTQVFELNNTSDCQDTLSAITPAARMMFTFIQMYYIFLNAKMTIHENRAIAYFGIMHLLATNMCIWLYVIIEETKHDVHSSLFGHDLTNESVHDGGHSYSSIINSHDPVADALTSEIHTAHGPVSNLSELHSSECGSTHVLDKLVHNASPFLFPCVIEYSLICAAIVYEMWKNVGLGDPTSHRGGSISSTMPPRRSRHHYSVDCAKSNKGLFLGIFVLVLALISLLMFFTLNNTPDFKSVAILEVNASRLVMICMAFIAVLIGMFQIRELRFNSSRRLALDEMLLVFGQSGVISYNIFTIIAAYYHFNDQSDVVSLLVLMSALAALAQAIAQTLFILDGTRRNTYTADQQLRKPGREVVTFLLVANFAMWTFNTLEKSRADVTVNPIQLNFYGNWPWIIITNVSMPLAIFYRFHSTVVLCEIWKRCYKVKPDYF